MACEDRGRDGGDAKESHAWLQPPEMRRGKAGFFPRAFRGEQPWDTLMSQCHLQNHERINVCCSESLCLCHLLRQLQETKIPPSPNLFSPQQPRDPGHIFAYSNPTMALLSFRVKAKVLTVIRMTPHHLRCPLTSLIISPTPFLAP